MFRLLLTYPHRCFCFRNLVYLEIILSLLCTVDHCERNSYLTFIFIKPRLYKPERRTAVRMHTVDEPYPVRTKLII